MLRVLSLHDLFVDKSDHCFLIGSAIWFPLTLSLEGKVSGQQTAAPVGLSRATY